MAEQLEAGLVVSVAEVTAGDELLAATPAGATTLVLGDAVDFPEDGGELLIADTLLAYTSADLDTDTLHLTAPTTAAYAEGDAVLLSPLAVERLASVALDGDDESVEARVPHALFDRIPEGVRDPGTEERVSVTLDGSEWVVADVLGREPLVDGAYLDPATVPTTDTGPTEPPATSPLLTITGTTNGLVVRADEVEPDSLIAYHITATPPLDTNGEALPFTPDATTLLGQPTRSTVLVVTQLPDGTALVPDTTYYLRAVASNVLGAAPPGPQADGSLDLSVVADEVAATVTAGFLLAGSIQVGQITIDPDSGITIPTTGGGITLPADGGAATFSGHVNASSVQVDDLLVINGSQNRINGQLLLNNVVEAPKAAPSYGWQFPGEVTIGSDIWSLTDSPDGSKWVSVEWGSGDIRTYSKTTGALIDAPTQASYRLRSITRIGDRYYAVASADSTGAMWCVVYSATFAKLNEWWVTSGANVPKQPAIGVDEAGRVVIAWTRSGGDLRVSQWSTTGTQISSVVHDTSAITGGAAMDLTNIHRLPVGPTGGNDWVLGALWDIYRYPQSNTTVTEANTLTRPEAVKGIHWDGTRIRTLGYTSFRIWKWGTNQWTTPVSISHTWYDDDPAGTGVHETTAGPAASYSPPTLSYLRIYPPVPPDDGTPDAPNAARLYLDNKLHTGEVYGSYRIFESVSATGTAPPATNGFAGATTTPGSLTSANGTSIVLRGDGSGNVGGVEWNASGTVTKDPWSARITNLETKGPWRIVGNSGEPGFVNGWSERITDSVKFRLNQAGDLLTVTADLNVPASGHGTTIFTLPVGLRPGVDILSMFGWHNSSGNRMCLVDAEASGAIRWWNGGNPTGTRAVFTIHVPMG